MSPRLLFRTFAFAEVVTWAGLITSLILRATGVVEEGTSIAGGVHGFVFLCYSVTTVFVWINQRWRPGVGLIGLVSAVIPFATVPFELWVDKRHMLAGGWRLAPGGEAPRGFVEHVQAWILRHLVLSIVAIVLLIIVVFLVLLWLGPPIPKS